MCSLFAATTRRPTIGSALPLVFVLIAILAPQKSAQQEILDGRLK
jgi:hypothetical protein